MRDDEGPPNGSHRTTPGGGLNEGGNFPAAALRQLAEETGWSDVPLGAEVSAGRGPRKYAGLGWSSSGNGCTWARTSGARSRQIHGVDAMHVMDVIAPGAGGRGRAGRDAARPSGPPAWPA